MTHLSEQEIVRRDKKAELERIGIPPYPSKTFEITTTPAEILENFTEETAKDFKEVRIAGRIMAVRVMGLASFIEIQYEATKIQVYVSRDSICKTEDKTLYNVVFKKLIDIGDIVGVSGYVFLTNVGVVSLHAESFELLSKALKPLPIVKEVVEGEEKKMFDAFTDPEARYRQRYVDLIVNPSIAETFRKRTQLISSIRNSLNDDGYLEVETPILQPIYGGALARPFTTHHNALDMQLYLRISNELYLKRLIVGGYTGVYEFSKDFRNEGMSRFHNPEFTMLELYVAYKDYKWMMTKTEEIIEKVALDLHKKTKISVGGNEVDFTRPWKKYSIYSAIEHFTGVDVSGMNEDTLRALARDLKIELEAHTGRAKIIDEIFGSKCEPQLINPTFITDHPVEMSPLAKKHKDKPDLVERFEVICNGKEICNAYSELNDPLDQRQRFEEQLTLAARGDLEAMGILDEDFLNAIEYGMPPTAGLGVGIDRLAMIMTDTNSIQDVLFFPQMRPKK